MVHEQKDKAQPAVVGTTPYYLWIRVLNATADAVDRDVRIVATCGGVRPASGPRQPGEGSGGGGPMVAAAAPELNAGVWSIVGTAAGNPRSSVVIDTGPAFVAESDALKWLDDTPDGRSWRDAALNYLLVEAMGCKGEDATRDPDMPKPVENTTLFAPDRWGKGPKSFLKMRPGIDPFPSIHVKGRPLDQELKNQCEQLLALKVEREMNKELIFREAQSDYHAIQPVLDAAGIDIDGGKDIGLRTLRSVLNYAILIAVYREKELHAQPRPADYCPDIDPMFISGHRLYPDHPSYPSGHATLAYTWAYMLGDRGYGKPLLLEEAARMVARRREIAGVHFKTDSDAGRELGREIANALSGDLLAARAASRFHDLLHTVLPVVTQPAHR